MVGFEGDVKHFFNAYNTDNSITGLVIAVIARVNTGLAIYLAELVKQNWLSSIGRLVTKR